MVDVVRESMGVVSAKAQPAERGLAALRRLRALVLLGGVVRTGRLTAGIGRSIMELPLEAGCTLIDAWQREAALVAPLVDRGILPVNIMIDRTAVEPRVGGGDEAQRLAPVLVERDPFDYRGTGGVLRDVSGRFADDDLLLVANAAQVLMTPLVELLKAMAQTGGDVAVVSHRDGTPSGLYLVRCGALRDLPGEGFLDMKEQALPEIAERHCVKVLELEEPSGIPVRTLSDYLQALKIYHKRLKGKAQLADPFAEDWEPSFGIVEQGADVHSAARLHDSVVLKGGKVEAGAVVVHSVVCPGGVVRRGQMSIDELVSAGNGRRKD